MPTKKQKDELRRALDAVDWARIDAMTDEEIEAAAVADPDNPPLTDEQLRSMRRVTSEEHARFRQAYINTFGKEPPVRGRPAKDRRQT